MDPNEIVDRLIGAGVLRELDDGESLALEAGFSETKARHLRDVSALDDETLERRIASIGDGAVRLPGERRERIDLLASVRALADHVTDLPDERLLQLLPVLDRFSDSPARDDGVPEAFVSVTGGQLRSFLRISRRAIVYVWRDDCPPCDATVEDLDAIFPEPLDDVALLATYGPDYPDVMDDLDVVGAPTLLFVLDGEVDTRLQGPQYPEVIENELETLRELS